MKILLKTAALILAVMTALVALSSCGSNTYYNFDISEYITLGDYKSTEVPDEDVEEYITGQVATLLANASEYAEVERAAAKDDQVSIEYVGKLDGVAFENGSGTKEDLVIGSGAFIEDLENGIIGHTAGEAFTVDATFPDPYQTNPDMAGKTVQFDVTLNKVSAKQVPELNDEFVAEKYPDEYATVDELKAGLRKDYLEQQSWAAAMSSSVFSALPKAYIKSYYNNYIDQSQQIAMQLGYDMTNYYSLFGSSTEEDFLDRAAENAIAKVKAELLTLAIAKAENIELSAEQLDAGYAEIAKENNYDDVETFKKEQKGKEELIRIEILQEYVLDFLADSVTVG